MTTPERRKFTSLQRHAGHVVCDAFLSVKNQQAEPVCGVHTPPVDPADREWVVSVGAPYLTV